MLSFTFCVYGYTYTGETSRRIYMPKRMQQRYIKRRLVQRLIKHGESDTVYPWSASVRFVWLG